MNSSNHNAGLASTHTSNLPSLCSELRISLLLASSPSNCLLIARADGDVINIHRLPLPHPAALCWQQQRLWVATRGRLAQYLNVPGAAGHVQPGGPRDACYLPWRHYTVGDLDIQDMAVDADGVLWFVSARFSCLCTLAEHASFTPRWQPPFISACLPQDRCHLNGLALREGRAVYITALGNSDSENGWRAHAGNSGIIIDIHKNAIVARELSLPNSPRWHQQQLWFLQAGNGSLNTFEPASGRITQIAELPGYATGLQLLGHIAFVATSAQLPGMPTSHTAMAANRTPAACGVWLVDIRNGQSIGFIDFKGDVQFLGALQIVPGVVYPEVLADDHALLANTVIVPDNVPTQSPTDSQDE